jgi:hypothetical protein
MTLISNDIRSLYGGTRRAEQEQCCTHASTDGMCGATEEGIRRDGFEGSWGSTENVGYRESGGQSIVLSFFCLVPQYTNIILVATYDVRHSSDTTHPYPKHQK